MTIPTAQKTSYRLLLTIPEAAQVLGVSRSILYQLVQAGEVATIKIGRSRRVPIVALEQYVSARLTPSWKDGRACLGEGHKKEAFISAATAHGPLLCRLKASERPSTQPLGRKFKRNSRICRRRPGAVDLHVKAVEPFPLIRQCVSSSNIGFHWLNPTCARAHGSTTGSVCVA